jgi:hypothetical protein
MEMLGEGLKAIVVARGPLLVAFVLPQPHRAMMNSGMIAEIKRRHLLHMRPRRSLAKSEKTSWENFQCRG